MADNVAGVLAAISIVIALLLAVPIVDNLHSNAATPDERITRQAAFLEDTSTFINLNDGEGVDETVYKSTGYAVNLSGTDDSYIQSSQNVDFATDKNWTVSVWASKPPGAPTGQQASRRAVLSLNGRLIIYHEPSLGQWSAWYYDEGETNSYRVNVSTGGGSSTLQNVIVRANGTHLSIYRNNTVGETKSITTESIVDAPVSSSNWYGRIEEIRTFDEALDNTNRSELVNSPVEQQPDLNRTSRIMFDQPDKSTQLLLFTDADVNQFNVTYSQGHAEDIVDSPSATNDILLQTDYEWRPHGPAIRPISGRELDGAPVAYVSYDFGSELVNDMVTNISDAIGLASLIPVIIVVVLILSRVRGM